MKVLITGADGFVAKNLRAHLAERSDINILLFSRENEILELYDLVKEVDFVFHLAGVNRTHTVDDFRLVNQDLTQALCDALSLVGRKTPVLFTSSTQASLPNPYGLSKLAAEKILRDFSEQYATPVYIYRLPNIFGKWAKPNYNSAVATFCHNIAHDLPIQVNDSAAEMTLAYVDDVVTQFIRVMDGFVPENAFTCMTEPLYNISVGELANTIYAFRNSRNTLVTESVGCGLIRALYATYVSYFSPAIFSYPLPKYADERGVFVEMLKTKEAGQFSFFTAYPGITRGGHYHHSKTEKFLVIKGRARFGFRHIISSEYHEVLASGEEPTIIETVPGWAHDITNVGTDEMIVMLWANEIFDRAHPDTYVRVV